MTCNCKIINNSSQTITSLVLGHSPGNPVTNNIAKVLSVGPLAPGQSSPVSTAAQQRFSTDWWTMVVSFQGDNESYYLANDVLPIAECEVPENGSIQFLITGTNATGTCNSETFSDPDFSASDGNCSEEIVTKGYLIQQAGGDAEEIAKIIEKIIEGLG